MISPRIESFLFFFCVELAGKNKKNGGDHSNGHVTPHWRDIAGVAHSRHPPQPRKIKAS